MGTKVKTMQLFLYFNSTQDHKSLGFCWIHWGFTSLQKPKINLLYFAVVTEEWQEVTKASRLGWEIQNIHKNCLKPSTNKCRIKAIHPLPALNYVCPATTRHVWMKKQKGKKARWERSCMVLQEMLVTAHTKLVHGDSTVCSVSPISSSPNNRLQLITMSSTSSLMVSQNQNRSEALSYVLP